MSMLKEFKQDVILLNNLFNGTYVSENVGGEIINIYQSDNGKYYIYANPYGNINNKWDNRIKYILFIRSIGNRIVKVIGKAEIDKQICLNAVRQTNSDIDENQKKYIDDNNITYGNVKIYNLGSWSNYFVTFEAKAIYLAKTDIYLATDTSCDSLSENIFVLDGVNAINNQSQKLYIESGTENFRKISKIIDTDSFWEPFPVGKVEFIEKIDKGKSFLSIIRKENDELVNSNLLAYFLENDIEFWHNFVRNVLGLDIQDSTPCIPKITRESIGNIDLFIEIGKNLIVIENKIKSGINGRKENGYSQLEKYVKIAEEFQDGKYKDCIYFYILRPNYNNENYTNFNKGKLFKEIKYSHIYDIIKNKTGNLYFSEFKSVVKKHSAEYNNELFELVNERFLEQIKIKS